jgi:hypothetical protein
MPPRKSNSDELPEMYQEPLTAADLDQAPKFFADEEIDWTEDRVEVEIQALMKACRKELNNVRKKIIEGLKSYISKTKVPSGAAFWDFHIAYTNCFYFYALPVKEKDTSVYDRFEIILDRKHPLNGWQAILINASRPLYTSDFGKNIYHKLEAAAVDEAIDFFADCRKAAHGPEWKVPAFYRRNDNQEWMDLESGSKNLLSMKEVKALAKKRPVEK